MLILISFVALSGERLLQNINNNFSIFDFIYFPFLKTYFNDAKLVVIFAWFLCRNVQFFIFSYL